MSSPDLEWRRRFELVTRIVSAMKSPPSDFSVSAGWTDAREWEAGINVADDGITVSYGPASATVQDPVEALHLLTGIFSDEIVCITALERDTPVLHALARHDDPTSSFNRLNKSALSRDMPAIDHVTAHSWTGKHDRE